MTREQNAKTVMDALKEEGFAAHLDDDGDVVLKYEGLSYIYIFEDDDGRYIRCVLPNIWNLESDAEIEKAYKACSYASREIKVAKAYVTKKNNVWIAAEMFFPDIKSLLPILMRPVSAVQSCANKFAEFMRE